jgi:hypothetical protein
MNRKVFAATVVGPEPPTSGPINSSRTFRQELRLPLDMTTTVAGSPSVGGTLTRRNGS